MKAELQLPVRVKVVSPVNSVFVSSAAIHYYLIIWLN